MRTPYRRDELIQQPPCRYEYDQNLGDYVYLEGQRLLFRTTEVAIYYTEDGGLFGETTKPNYTIHKHGIPEQVELAAQIARQAFNNAGFTQLASSIAIISSNKWDLEKLNRIISTSGYFGRFLEENVTSLT